MFLVDSSIWVAQAYPAHPNYALAHSALAHTTAERPAVFCRATQQSFLRLMTTPAIFQLYQANMTNAGALGLLEHLMAKSSVAFREEPPGLLAHWRRLAGRPSASPRLWMDAYLAAFAVAADLTMLTLDADFRQFERVGLKLQLLQPA